MGFGIDRRARSRKARSGLRGLFGKPPEAREVADRLGRLGRRMLKDYVIDASPKRLTLRFHPAASPVRVAVLPDGDLEVHGDTAAIGPGYHADVLAHLDPILEELEYAWAEPPGDPRAEMTAWLAGELAGGATRFGLPAERSFRIPDAAVLTPLGPRDAAWRDAVIADPARAADAFAWWDGGRGRAARSRALLAMWLEVPWREPLDDDEAAMMERAASDLASAHRADPSLELPYAAWAELLDLVGGDDDQHAAEVRERAKAAPAAPIGYRRYPMDVELSGGWSLVLPGAFVGHWEDDGARWWATDGGRVVEFTSLSAGDETDSERLLGVAPEAHPVVERRTDGEHRGRAEVSDDGDVHVVHGLVARAPHVAILTLKGRTSDEPWALETWRSLRNA